MTPATCDDPVAVVVAGVDTGVDTCAGGFTHRREPVECPSALPRAGERTDCVELLAELPEQVDCTADSACGPDAFCAYDDFCLGSCACAQGCRSDDDCGAEQLCACGDPIGTCVSASCRTDEDCDGDALCLGTTFTFCDEGFVFTTRQGFACSTPDDECLTADDCEAGEVCQAIARPEGGVRRTCQVLGECEGSSCGP